MYEDRYYTIEEQKDQIEEPVSPREHPEKAKKKKGRAGRILCGILGCILLCTSVFGGSYFAMNHIMRKSGGAKEGNSSQIQMPEENQVPGESKEPEVKVQIGSTEVLNQPTEGGDKVKNVVKSAMPSIVSITSTVTETYDWFGQAYNQDVKGSGSGIIIDQTESSLLIATNEHVVEGATSLQVTFCDENTAEGTVQGADSTNDLAVISVNLSDLGADTLSTIATANLGDSSQMAPGEMVVAIGNAMGYGQTVTVGYISATDREVQVDQKNMELLQTDAAINPGNSGGALLNLQGEVIGINSVKYADTQVEGMGFAIPISTAEPIIEELKHREILADDEKGYLGISGNEVNQEIAEAYNMPMGAYVYSVTENGPADQAGILKGDIITHVNHIAVNTMRGVKEQVNAYRIGTEVTITLERNIGGEYQEQEVKVILGDAKQVEQQ